MKILLATKTMDVGGIERSVVILARELRRRGHQVWVVSSGGYLVRDLDQDGTPHVTAPLVLTSPSGMARSASVLRRLICDEHVDLVHSFAATTSVALNVAMRARPLNGISTVRFVSSPMGLQNSPRERPATTWLRNWFLTLGAERILVISPEIRRHLKRAGARDEHLVDFNFVGLDLDKYLNTPSDYTSVRQEFGFPDDSLVVSTIGALHPRKSHHLFVDMAEAVQRAEPRTRFLVVGGGELQDELAARAREKGLGGKLVLTGVRDDIARLLAATDVYAKPGVLEGFIGITVLEAMAMGKPVVAYETEDVKLALTHGVTGIIVPNGDVGAMAANVVRLLRDTAEGERLGAAGRAVVRDHYHFGLLAERLEHFYEQMVRDPKGAVTAL